MKLDPDGGDEGDKVDGEVVGGDGGDGDVHFQRRRQRRRRRDGKKEK